MNDFHKKVMNIVGMQTKDMQGCVLCGNLITTKEDVIPKWLQRMHGLASQKFTRPNGTPMRYSQLTVSLCASCNNVELSKIEKLISKVANSGSDLKSENSLDFQIWLTKIYYFLQLFENSRSVHVPGGEPAKLVTDKQIFDNHLLQLHIKAAGQESNLSVSGEELASVWCIDCHPDWKEGEFMFGSSPGQNIIALKIRQTAVFAIVGDWGQYKIGGALNSLVGPIDKDGFMLAFKTLRYFVDKNRISTSFGFMGKEDGEDLKLLPFMIRADDMDFTLGEDFDSFD